MHCVLVWRDTRRGGALVSGTAFGIGAGLLRPQGRRARLPDPLSLARAELGLRRAVLQASHVSALVRMTEAALLHDPAQHDEPALSQAARP